MAGPRPVLHPHWQRHLRSVLGGSDTIPWAWSTAQGRPRCVKCGSIEVSVLVHRLPLVHILACAACVADVRAVIAEEGHRG